MAPNPFFFTKHVILDRNSFFWAKYTFFCQAGLFKKGPRFRKCRMQTLTPPVLASRCLMHLKGMKAAPSYEQACALGQMPR